ncbi:hypothetical protein LBMAG46_33710 [Planctomycetia bacterium]|nr:hypothetical protein LBMAG46_33710 [Planctomycetia bacterium]
MFAGVFFAQVSLIPVLWQAGLCPLTPVPLSRWGRGEDFVFKVQRKAGVEPFAPGIWLGRATDEHG